MSAKKNIYTYIILFLPIIFLSCSPKNMIVHEVALIVEKGSSVYEQEDDLYLLEKAIPGNIKLLEAMLETNPKDKTLLILLARMYSGYSLAYLESELDAHFLEIDKGSSIFRISQNATEARNRLVRYYGKASEYAIRALEVDNPGCRELLNKISTIQPFLDTLGLNDVDALFWYAFTLGSWVNHNLGSVKSISKAHIAEKAMLRVLELNPSYYFGNGHLFLMTYYGSRTPIMGGDPNKALSHYNALKKISGGTFYLADFYYARYVLIQAQDEERFRQVLSKIINNSSKDKSYNFFNAIARVRANYFLKTDKEIFE